MYDAPGNKASRATARAWNVEITSDSLPDHRPGSWVPAHQMAYTDQPFAERPAEHVTDDHRSLWSVP